MKKKIKWLRGKLHLDYYTKTWFRRKLRSCKRRLMRTDNKIMEDYSRKHRIAKLQLGCGGHIIDGWLNSDYNPTSASVLQLDATQPFPFKDGTFDYIFNEHLIEHISYPQGMRMLAECYRVLAPGGKIRISTPDLAFLVALYRNEKSELQKAYIAWATDTFIAHAPFYDEVFLINNFVKDWGHQFIYDEKTLRYALEKNRFSDVTQCDLNHSRDNALCNLENEGHMPRGFLQLETLVLEGTKPEECRQGRDKS